MTAEAGGAAGFLTDWDIRLLQRHVRFYESLHRDMRRPSTHRQRRFVEVCRGRMAPVTQHEIAFARYLAAQGSRPIEGLLPGGRRAAPVSPAVRLVDHIDEQLISDDREAAEAAQPLRHLRDLYESGAARGRRASSDAAVWVSSILSDPEVSGRVAAWTSDQYGQLSNVYTKAMDGAFAEGLRSGDGYISPSLHRLFEGHSPLAAWGAVRDALPDDSRVDEWIGYITAMGSDAATAIGLPLAQLSPDQYELLKHVAVNDLGISEGWLIDMLHVNAAEIAAGAIPLAAAAYGWSTGDAEAFARLAGSLAVGSILAANPIGAVIAIGLLASSFNKSAGSRESRIGAVVGGGVTSGGFLTATMVFGTTPVLFMLGGLALAAHLRKASSPRPADHPARQGGVRLGRALGEFVDTPTAYGLGRVVGSFTRLF